MWGDADTAIGGNRDHFPSPQLSLIGAATGEPLAMERVVALYWKPVYKFIRFKFHQNNEAAKDLLQPLISRAGPPDPRLLPSVKHRHYCEPAPPSAVANTSLVRVPPRRISWMRSLPSALLTYRTTLLENLVSPSSTLTGLSVCTLPWRSIALSPSTSILESPGFSSVVQSVFGLVRLTVVITCLASSRLQKGIRTKSKKVTPPVGRNEKEIPRHAPARPGECPLHHRDRK